MLKESAIFILEFVLDSRMANLPMIRGFSGRLYGYQSVGYYIDTLLNCFEVKRFTEYRGDDASMYEFGLFNNPTFLVFRVAKIFAMIDLNDPVQQEYVWDFFVWLGDTFQPFLDHIEQYIPAVRQEVDTYLVLRFSKKNLSEIQRRLSYHFSAKHLLQIVSFNHGYKQANAWVPPRFLDHFSPCTGPILGIAMGRIYGNSCERQLGDDEIETCFSNIKLMLKFQGLSLRRKLLTLSVSFSLIRKLLYSNPILLLILMRRVCSRSLQN
jgi:hypothetical protein